MRAISDHAYVHASEPPALPKPTAIAALSTHTVAASSWNAIATWEISISDQQAISCSQSHSPHTWGASSAAAKIYSNEALFGPISVGFRVVQPLIAEYGVLTWRTSRNARYVSGPTATLHAVNRPFIPGVRMACNTASRSWAGLISSACMDAVKMACMLLWYIFAALLDAPQAVGR
jgi:hypothetical protein